MGMLHKALGPVLRHYDAQLPRERPEPETVLWRELRAPDQKLGHADAGARARYGAESAQDRVELLRRTARAAVEDWLDAQSV
jgi:hypothetical protein